MVVEMLTQLIHQVLVVQRSFKPHRRSLGILSILPETKISVSYSGLISRLPVVIPPTLQTDSLQLLAKQQAV